jgi:hypothetical protein
LLAVRLEGLFWVENKVGCPFFLMYGFGLWAWPLEALHYAMLKSPNHVLYRLFSAHFLDSQQSLAIQSHGQTIVVVWGNDVDGKY